MDQPNPQGWMQEFYPVPAQEVPVDQAGRHSKRKWIGARPENLRKYGLDSPPIYFDSDSCALCVHYAENKDCTGCPIAGDTDGCDTDGPFGEYFFDGDPEPMIAVLERHFPDPETSHVGSQSESEGQS